MAGETRPDAGGEGIVDIGGASLPAHSQKGDSAGIRTSTVEPDTRIRSGARATGDAPAGQPTGMRPITRKERPRPGAQLHPTVTYGTRLTAPATNTKHTPAARLQLGHGRQPAQKQI
ncbi:hypothetical protein [Streptomyces phaeochromogenes]|uniref:hypothetical protein n=1 Tax=Streptomyces phaeochromogenes TaxID=1923 RepID=UPI0036860DF7